MDILAAGARARLHLPTATQGRERICRAEPQAARQAPSDLGDPLSELFTEEALSWRYHTTRPVGVHNVFYPDGTARTVGDTVH
ncbi:MAG TPA: hypothetical protein VJW23_04665, partial [Propionibacteriaceae bacterium]|nr:hypothetical protein [Propionibacteriaceae bacterium]